MAAVSAAQQIIAELPDDERLRLDTIHGETELLELMDRYAEAAIADRLLAKAAREHIAAIDARAARHKEVVRRILDAVGLTSVRRPLYTVATSHRAHAIITDADAVPAQYLSPDRVAIAAALHRGEAVPGAELSNPQPSLTLRMGRNYHERADNSADDASE